MHVRQRMRDALAGAGICESQMRAIDLLSQGFTPEEKIDLVSLSKALSHIVDRNACLEKQLCETDEKLRSSERHVALGRMRNKALAAENVELKRLCVENELEAQKCREETEKAWAVAEHYRQLAGVKEVAKKVVDRFTLTVNNLFVTYLKSEPVKVSVNDGGQYVETINKQSNNYGRR